MMDEFIVGCIKAVGEYRAFPIYNKYIITMVECGMLKFINNVIGSTRESLQ